MILYGLGKGGGGHGGGGHGGGGHGDGHGGGGHHGGGHHGHDHGGFFPGGWGGGSGWWDGYGYPYVIIADAACPQTVAPVLGVDGQMYMNACFANAAGVAVARSLSGLRGSSSDVSSGLTILAVLGVIALGLKFMGRERKSKR